MFDGSGYDLPDDDSMDQTSYVSIESEGDTIHGSRKTVEEKNRVVAWLSITSCPECGSCELFSFYNTFDDKYIIQCNAEPKVVKENAKKTIKDTPPLTICGWNIQL